MQRNADQDCDQGPSMSRDGGDAAAGGEAGPGEDKPMRPGSPTSSSTLPTLLSLNTSSNNPVENPERPTDEEILDQQNFIRWVDCHLTVPKGPAPMPAQPD